MQTIHTKSLMIMFVCCLLTKAALGDHLPESKIARGDADTVLSGVDVYHTTMRQVCARLGKPTTSEVIPTKDDVVGGKQFEWKPAAVRLVLMTWNDKGDESIPYSIEAWGSKPDGKIGVTGRGLGLGAALVDVMRIYGPRLSKSKRDDGTLQVIVQWQDETTLYIYFNKAGRVNRLHLMASIE